jgi:uncharacterized protein (DUF934 family)
MAKLINQQQLLTDEWVRLDDDAALPPLAPIFVSLARWQRDRPVLLSHKGLLGVELGTHDEVSAIATDLEEFGLIAVHFPKFTDGRGYSIARTLRDRLGYGGELRATGDVLRDQLFNLARVGFDAFALRDDQDVEVSLAAFQDFSEAYQASVERPVPLFRRRVAAGA